MGIEHVHEFSDFVAAWKTEKCVDGQIRIAETKRSAGVPNERAVTSGRFLDPA